MAELIDMRGSVVSILYGPADDGYLMISLHDDRGERVVAAGRAIPADVTPGDEISISGRWSKTNRGPVLQAASAHRALPRTAEGIRRWLAKAKIPGIGVVKAQKLVDLFGMDTIEAVVQERPEAAAVIGRKATPRAAEALRERRQEAEIGATLSEHGIGGRVQRKILDRYGDKTHQILTEEPYRLIIDIEGVAFQTADRIAQAAGLSKEAPDRVRAALVDQLRQASNSGHCALYQQQLVDRTRQAIYVDEDRIERELEELEGKQIVRTSVRGMPAWALKRLNRLENEYADLLVRKLRDHSMKDFGRAAVEEAVAQAESNLDIELSEEQRGGAVMALTSRVSILTGGPGTGKTHTLRIICEAWRLLAGRIPVFTEENRQIALAAPTGKAAKRITETTGMEGKTIHRLLEYRPDINDFERNQENPLLVGTLAIDEASMPDIAISAKLGRAWGKAKVLFSGDIDQLPSVGPGKVLADMLASEVVPHTRLTRIFRQAAGSAVALGADRIRVGEMPDMAKAGRGDLVHIELERPEMVSDRIVSMYADRLPSYAEAHGIDPTSIQILCPGHQSEVGTIALNAAIQRRLHGDEPDTPQITISERARAGAGDKVIQLENDYERNIFNGDTGMILEVERKGDSVTTHVDFAGNIQSFPGGSLVNLGLAYALSIHKSQGSEYQIVVIPVTTSHSTMLRRTLLYTGVTRAKRLCILVGTRRAIRMAVSREDASSRITTLRDAIVRRWEETA